MKSLSSKGLECILVPFLSHTVTQLFNRTVYDDKRRELQWTIMITLRWPYLF